MLIDIPELLDGGFFNKTSPPADFVLTGLAPEPRVIETFPIDYTPNGPVIPLPAVENGVIVETVNVREQSLAPIQVDEYNLASIGEQIFSNPRESNPGYLPQGLNQNQSGIDNNLIYFAGAALAVMVLFNLRK